LRLPPTLIATLFAAMLSPFPKREEKARNENRATKQRNCDGR